MAALTGLVFVGSALLGRPLTAKLVGDFVHLPPHVCSRDRVRTMFRDLAIIWGVSRLVGAAMGFGLLHADAGTAAVGRGAVSPMLTVLTIVLCVAWGWRSLAADGVQFRRFGSVPTPS
jgi:hypothetical protein